MDLRTRYMGIDLKNPIIASASPLSNSIDNIRRMEDNGAAAVVMFSLFEEQLQHESAALEHLMESGANSFAESLSYFPEVDDYTVGPDRYLDLLRRAVEAVDIPIIASLNGVSNQGWINIAKQMQDTGASGIELNVYYIPAQLDESGRDVEERYLEIVKAVKSAVTVPVALKMSPFFSAVGNMAKQLDAASIDALVLFNRFYQPDFDLDKLEVIPNLHLSTATEIRLPLLWIAILYNRLNASLAATTGVQSPSEIIKYLMAGADAVMTASALLHHGVDFLRTLTDGLSAWLEYKGYESVSQLKGSMSQQHVADPNAFERANYIKVLESYKSPFML